MHQAESEHMSFQSKNFSYTNKEFGIFLDEVHAGGRQYLRSISADQPSKLPANLAMDFPNLQDDFRLPSSLSFVTENAHSSPLRISGPVTLWLHYDVSSHRDNCYKTKRANPRVGNGKRPVPGPWGEKACALSSNRRAASTNPSWCIQLHRGRF